MLSKTLFAATALAATVAATDLPTCWSDCFSKYEVDSEGCLCSDALGSVVSSCIASGCASADSDAYSAWLQSYCYVAPVSSNTWSAPASTYDVPSSSVPAYPVASSSSYAAPSYPAEPSSSAAPPSYGAPPASSGAAPSYGAPPASYEPSSPASSAPAYPTASACTGKTTMIWRSSTSVVYGTWGSSAAVAATGTAGAAYPSASSWAPVPATGAGAKLAGAGFGAFGLIAGVAALLL